MSNSDDIQPTGSTELFPPSSVVKNVIDLMTNMEFARITLAERKMLNANHATKTVNDCIQQRLEMLRGVKPDFVGLGWGDLNRLLCEGCRAMLKDLDA